MANPTCVFMFVIDPNDERVSGPGLPPTTVNAYSFPIEGTIDETVQAQAKVFPLGSIIHVTTDARCDTYVLNASLDVPPAE